MNIWLLYVYNIHVIYWTHLLNWTEYIYTYRWSIWIHMKQEFLYCKNTWNDQVWAHLRLPCWFSPSPTPGAYSNSCPLSLWCHPTISSSAVHFFCLQSFPASGSFQMSHFFASGGQSIGTSASILSMNNQDWFPLEWTGWISLQSKGLSRVFSNTTVQKHQFFSDTQLSLQSNSHIHTWLLEKTKLWLDRPLLTNVSAF